MPDDRLTKQIFLWDRELNLNNWSSNIGKICELLKFENNYYNSFPISLLEAKKNMFIVQQDEWKLSTSRKAKLRKYKDIKLHMNTEQDVKLNLTRKERSLLA